MSSGQRSGASRKVKVERTWASRPMAPLLISSISRAVCGEWRHMNASMQSRSCASAVSKTASTSSGCALIGFSQSTCLPASSARLDHSQCNPFGSEM